MEDCQIQEDGTGEAAGGIEKGGRRTKTSDKMGGPAEEEGQKQNSAKTGDDCMSALEHLVRSQQGEAAVYTETVKRHWREMLRDLPKGSAKRVAKIKEMMGMQQLGRDCEKRAKDIRGELNGL